MNKKGEIYSNNADLGGDSSAKIRKMIAIIVVVAKIVRVIKILVKKCLKKHSKSDLQVDRKGY